MRAALALLLLAAAWPAHAGGDGRGTGTHDAGGPTVITADRLVVDDRAQRAHFSGHVVLVRGAFRLECPTLVARYAERKGRLAFVRAEAEGGVRFADPRAHGRSDRAIYEADRERVVLVGHAVVEREGGRIEGERIVHSLATGRTEAAPPPGGRVRVRIDGEPE